MAKPTMAAAKPSAKRVSDKAIDKIYNDVMTCQSAIPAEEMQPLADHLANRELFVRPWRLVAMLAAKDGAFFREVSEDAEKAKALAPMVDVLDHFAGLMRRMAELAECASARVSVAGCNHKDFNVWANERCVMSQKPTTPPADSKEKRSDMAIADDLFTISLHLAAVCTFMQETLDSGHGNEPTRDNRFEFLMKGIAGLAQEVEILSDEMHEAEVAHA